MGRLRFSFGTMGSGKSTMALQIHHNLAGRGLLGLLCTMLDREPARVWSRLGVSAPAVEIDPTLDFGALAASFVDQHGRLDYLVCDEAQFYEPAQIEQLALIVDEHGTDVYAFGLRADFRSRLFPGTARLIELADECQELQVETRCWCGARATQNARVVNDVIVYEGDIVVVAGTDETAADPFFGDSVRYELLCRRHWRAGDTGRRTLSGW
jgi:thymidine kinase